MILVSVNVTLSGKQQIVEGKPAIFHCTTPFGLYILRYIWKLGGTLLSNNILQYTFVPNRSNNSQILSCTAVTGGGAYSQESTRVASVL